MKRIALTLCVMLSALACLAGNPLKNIVGKENLKAIMADKAEACVVYDWSETKYDKTKDLKATLAEDYDFVISDSEAKFVAGFNQKSKALHLSTDTAGAKYRFVLKVTNLDRRFAVMAFVPGHEGKIWGTLEILDAATGTSLATITIDEAEEGYDFQPKKCIGMTFMNLGKLVAKLK